MIRVRRGLTLTSVRNYSSRQKSSHFHDCDCNHRQEVTTSNDRTQDFRRAPFNCIRNVDKTWTNRSLSLSQKDVAPKEKETDRRFQLSIEASLFYLAITVSYWIPNRSNCSEISTRTTKTSGGKINLINLTTINNVTFYHLSVYYVWKYQVISTV